jgi:hypothetical protein
VITHPIVNFTSCPAPRLPSGLLSDSEREVYEQISSTPVRIDELAGDESRSPENFLVFFLILNLKV